MRIAIKRYVLGLVLVAAIAAFTFSTTTLAGGKGKNNCWMTGGGSVFDVNGSLIEYSGRTTHGFVVHCDPRNSDNLQINWKGNRFHMTDLNNAICDDDPALTPESPDAQFDTFIGMGTGRLNNARGATVWFKFTDDGQPGVGDFAHIIISDPGGDVVLDVEGYLTFGNHQAHSN